MSRFLEILEDTKKQSVNTSKDVDLPAVITLKRKAVRQYPDNITVGLYYSEMLKKYFTVTITEKGSAENTDAGK